MAEQSELLKSAQQAVALRSRWETANGIKILDEIIRRIRTDDDSWVELPSQLETPEELRLPGDASTHQLDDLRGVCLNAYDLRGLDLSFIDFSFSFLRGTNLSGASFQGSTLHLADLSGSDLSNADMLQIKANQARFDGCDLTKAILLAARCEEASFHGADLQYALLDNGRFSKSDFTSANFVGAEHRQAVLDHLVISTETQGLQGLEDLRPVITAAFAQFTPQKYGGGAYWSKFRQMAHEILPTANDLVRIWAPNMEPRPVINNALFNIAFSWHPNVAGMSKVIAERCVIEAVRNQAAINEITVDPASGDVGWVFIVDSGAPAAVWPEAPNSTLIDQVSREMFTCFYGMGLSQQKLAEIYGVTQGHVKYELERARKVIEHHHAHVGNSIASSPMHLN